MPPDAKLLPRWIADLDNPQFARREEASRELEKIEELAAPALRQVHAGNPSLELRRRVERLLEKLEQTPPAPERLRLLRALMVLEYFGTREARELIETLTQGAPTAWLTREARAISQRLTSRLAP